LPYLYILLTRMTNDFIDRLSALARDGALEIYAWVLMPNPQILMMILTPKLIGSGFRVLGSRVITF
jgi:hypothetical protein